MRPSITTTSLSYQPAQCLFLCRTKAILHRDLQHCQRHRYKSDLGSDTGRRRIRRPRPPGPHEIVYPKDIDQTSFLKEKAASVSTPSESRHASSVTASEQAVFDSIWALFEKPSLSSARTRTTATDHNDTDVKNILELFSPITRQPDDATESQQTTDRDAPLLETKSSSDDDKSQGGAEKVTTSISQAFGRRAGVSAASNLNRESAMAEIRDFLVETTGPLKSSSLPTSMPSSESADAVRAATLRIVEDVADSFTTALTSTNPRPDIAMWRVAEEKIFPLIGLLRSTTSTLASSSPASTETESTSQSTTTSSPPSPPPSDSEIKPPQHRHPLIPPSLPLIPLLTQAYPSLTLLTLRLYTTHHPTSPYALALLPTLKSLGPTSYVLGAHTHFYNALLSLYWHVYSDLRTMHDLLVEMDTNGVGFDRATLEVLESVDEDRRRDLWDVATTAIAPGEGKKVEETENGIKTGRGKLWWTRHEQIHWGSRVTVEWRDLIRDRLDGGGDGDDDEDTTGAGMASSTSSLSSFDAEQGRVITL